MFHGKHLPGNSCCVCLGHLVIDSNEYHFLVAKIEKFVRKPSQISFLQIKPSHFPENLFTQFFFVPSNPIGSLKRYILKFNS